METSVNSPHRLLTACAWPSNSPVDLPHPNLTFLGRSPSHVSHANGSKKKSGVAILILDKLDFKDLVIKQQRKVLNNGKEKNSKKGYKNYKYVCTQWEHPNTESLYLGINIGGGNLYLKSHLHQ